MRAREQAEAAQREASDPAVSAFVAASAGSGKTKLLTDRLLRLMLAGADPQRIQCLTFTKAAAAEMALRLHAKLGAWVTLDDPALDAALRGLELAPGAALRQTARALFATVLDLPGGMRIGTIHAFCQSLLRRFPLEAEISPHFQLADDGDASQALLEAGESMLADPDTPDAPLEVLAGLIGLKGFGGLVAALHADEGALPGLIALGDGLEAAYRRVLGVAADSEAELIGAHVDGLRWGSTLSRWGEDLAGAAENVARDGSPGCRDKSRAILAWLAAPDPERWDEWRCLFLTQSGEARAASGFLNKKLADRHPELADPFLAEAERILATDDHCRALRLAEASAALVRLAAPVLRHYAERKDNSGLLDYDDLIRRTSSLLIDPGAAWVLYKLDGGLDHLLLDEVQDTAPAQWKIAHALTAEFFSGAGANQTRRTVFAVGDRKQSIFSFQGADAATFDASRAAMCNRVRESGQRWRDVAMDVSFRSTAPVLALVDAVFAHPEAAAGVSDQPIAHLADRAGVAGRVELWPLAPHAPAEDPGPWAVPNDNYGFESSAQRLADHLASWIARQTDGSVMLESRGRALAPGDVLVLLRRRGTFDRSLLRALKHRGVAVAGLDRLVLTEQPAVADLLTLCDVLLLPEDDLALACVLKSPLGGCDEDSLMRLAASRPRSLWQALRGRAGERADWAGAHALIADLLARVDYTTPYALLCEALVRLGGRARLFARLGPEAAEPVDELLNAALAYQRTHPPSLQGFVHWVRQSGAEVKREAEGAGGSVRIMTVHGAKGLQAPLVILPDTTGLPPDNDHIHWVHDATTGRRLPLWSPRREFRCLAVERERADAARLRTEEHNRLLYVALTRAEDRLLVCGWRAKTPPKETCWYSMIERGFGSLATEPARFDAWDGEAVALSSPQSAPPRTEARANAASLAPLPDWAGAAPDWRATPPPEEPAVPVHLAPSRPEHAELGVVPHAASPLAGVASGARFRRGRLVHALLQHLPELPRAARAEAARRWLARPAHAVPDVDLLVGEIMLILDHPELAPLFGPGSRAEVPLAGVIGVSVIGGLVDRLAVGEGRVLVADYKTNREPPVSQAETPALYLRQMAAYRAVLRAIHPGYEVRCALVWTRAARVDVLADALLDPHAPHIAPTIAAAGA